MPRSIISFEQLSDALQWNELRVTAIRITSVCELDTVEGNQTLEVHPFPTEFRIKEILRKLELQASLRHATIKAKSHAARIARSISMQRMIPASRLTNLELEAFHFDATVSFEPFAEAILQCPTLTKIAFVHCKMDRHSKDHFLALVQNHRNLCALDLGEGNDFSERLSLLLSRIILKGHLKELSFIVPEFDQVDRDKLLQAFQKNTTLENVHMEVPTARVALLDRRDRDLIKKLCDRNKRSSRSVDEDLAALLDDSVSWDESDNLFVGESEVSVEEDRGGSQQAEHIFIKKRCDTDELSERFDGLQTLKKSWDAPENEAMEERRPRQPTRRPRDRNELSNRFEDLVALQHSLTKTEKKYQLKLEESAAATEENSSLAVDSGERETPGHRVKGDEKLNPNIEEDTMGERYTRSLEGGPVERGVSNRGSEDVGDLLLARPVSDREEDEKEDSSKSEPIPAEKTSTECDVFDGFSPSAVDASKTPAGVMFTSKTPDTSMEETDISFISGATIEDTPPKRTCAPIQAPESKLLVSPMKIDADAPNPCPATELSAPVAASGANIPTSTPALQLTKTLLVTAETDSAPTAEPEAELSALASVPEDSAPYSAPPQETLVSTKASEERTPNPATEPNTEVSASAPNSAVKSEAKTPASDAVPETNSPSPAAGLESKLSISVVAPEAIPPTLATVLESNLFASVAAPEAGEVSSTLVPESPVSAAAPEANSPDPAPAPVAKPSTLVVVLENHAPNLATVEESKQLASLGVPRESARTDATVPEESKLSVPEATPATQASLSATVAAPEESAPTLITAPVTVAAPEESASTLATVPASSLSISVTAPETNASTPALAPELPVPDAASEESAPTLAIISDPKRPISIAAPETKESTPGATPTPVTKLATSAIVAEKDAPTPAAVPTSKLSASLVAPKESALTLAAAPESKSLASATVLGPKVPTSAAPKSKGRNSNKKKKGFLSKMFGRHKSERLEL